jgi:hypothetical protein
VRSVSDRPRGVQRRRPVRPAHGLCRLTIHINGTAYNVRPIAVDPTAADRAFRLRKADGVAYDVAATEHGPTCTCPDYVWARDGLDPAGCKHIRALTVVGLLPARKGVAR